MSAKYSTDTSVPKDFDIKVYDICASWKMCDWVQELNTRHYMDAVFEKAKKNELTAEFLDSYKVIADSLLSKPFRNKNTYYGICLSPIVDQFAGDFFAGYFAVRNRRYADWAARMFCAEDHADEVMMDEDSVIAPIREIVHEYDTTPAWKVHRDAGYTDSGERFFIGVDLRATDDFLVDQFRSWINKTRKDSGINSVKRTFGEKELNVWHKNRYLPLLDLYFWLLVNQIKINFTHIEGALFPNCEPRDRVRKSLLKSAVKLVSRDYRYALGVQQRDYSCVKKSSENSTWLERAKNHGLSSKP